MSNRISFLLQRNSIPTRTKILFACSYLDGIAFDWYTTYLDEEPEPEWFNDWKKFSKVLESHFGEVNAFALAERKIRQLRMGSSTTLVDYITKFHTQANRLDGWGEKALISEFRRGLASHLKDDLSKLDYDELDLAQLEQLCIKLESRHQERSEEKRNDHEPRATNTRTFKPHGPIPRAPLNFNLQPLQSALFNVLFRNLLPILLFLKRTSLSINKDVSLPMRRLDEPPKVFALTVAGITKSTIAIRNLNPIFEWLLLPSNCRETTRGRAFNA